MIDTFYLITFLLLVLAIADLNAAGGETIFRYENTYHADHHVAQRQYIRHRKLSNIFNRTRESTSVPSVEINRIPYYTTNNDPALLPRDNFAITIGNPLKGLSANPGNIHPRIWPANLPASIGVYKWPLSSFMLADPDVVGEDEAFNWTFIESQLAITSAYNLHAVIRFWIDYPGQPLRLPPYLLDSPYNLSLLANNTALYYDEPVLKKAINQTIQAFGRRYDGDTRIFMLQAGFFGAWGEWHTRGCKTKLANGTTVDCFPSPTAEEAVPWYRAAFKKTHVQFRYPDRTIAARLEFGYHDDSYTYSTLGGIYNGNSTTTRFFFWNISQTSNVTDFWKKGPMGGEVRPENTDVFTDGYPAYTPLHQDFQACANVTHTSYMLWGRGWSMNSGVRGVTGSELQRARNATVRMGYNFEIDSVTVTESLVGPSAVDVNVTIKQTGVAPFYYNLNVSLYCNGGRRYATTPVDVGSLLERGDTRTSTLQNVPSTSACLSAIEFRLESTYLFPNRPLRWAQGNNNGTVILSIPSVPTASPSAAPSLTPSSVPSRQPSLAPSARPSDIPSSVPSNQPTGVPSTIPSSAPSTKPSSVPSLSPSKVPTRLPTKVPTEVPTKRPTLAPTQAPYWAVDLYFVNITSQEIMYGIGPIRHLATYKSTVIGRELGILSFTNSSVTAFNFSWPVSKTKYDTVKPFYMGARNGTRYQKMIFLANNGAKAINMDVFVGTRIVSRSFINFTIIT